MLAAPCILAVCGYGARAIAVILTGVAAAVLSDMLFCALLKRNFLLRDLSNIYIGAVIALMLPAGVPLYVPATASVFAVITAKVPFGGSLRAPFVPAAAGFAFVSVCFKEQIFDFSYNSAQKMLGEHSLGALLLQGKALRLNAVNVFDILSGNAAGPMGAGCGLLMVACFVFLLVRRRGALFAPLSFIASCALYAAIMPRVNASALTSVFMELSSGSIMFAAAFLLSDYVTQPERYFTRTLYGASCGILCMLMRGMGTYEETVCFAVLLANAFSPIIDSAVKRIPSKKKSASTAGEGAAK
jgi:electron transport complex protein RnfD